LVALLVSYFCPWLEKLSVAFLHLYLTQAEAGLNTSIDT
jgi:hypothetical protein